MLDPTKRFSNKVENYRKYRPRYPKAIIPLLEQECGLTRDARIADIGSGTGLLAELFLEHGNRVIGIEPNLEMRVAGESMLARYPEFSSIVATAETTSLPDASVDFVTAGQSFHWFDPEKARAEFVRILRPSGWVMIVWNGFRADYSPINNAYQQLLLRYGTDYREVTRELESRDLEAFFAPGKCKSAHFNFNQLFDYAGLEGRLLSSSFIPERGHPNYEPMLRDLRKIFEAYQENGKVAFAYETEMYYGQLSISRADS